MEKEIELELLSAFLGGALEQWRWRQQRDPRLRRRTPEEEDELFAAALAKCLCRSFRVAWRKVGDERGDKPAGESASGERQGGSGRG